MKVLIACEESQRVCTEFRRLGHEAYSCDVQEPSGGHPEWHILGDVLEVLNPNPVISFRAMDGAEHIIDGRWDLIIAHPPCTYLSNAGACRLYPKKGQIDEDRFVKGMMGMLFFMKLYDADCEKICVENPIPSKVFGLPPYTQTIQPYEFWHPYSKKTCLWLKGLPKLMPTEIVREYKPYVSCRTSRNKGNPEKSGFSRAGGGAEDTLQNLSRHRKGNGGAVGRTGIRKTPDTGGAVPSEDDNIDNGIIPERRGNVKHERAGAHGGDRRR